MEIISFSPNQDNTSLILELSGAKDANYLVISVDQGQPTGGIKPPIGGGVLIDLTTLLNGDDNQVINIPYGTLGVSGLGGIYIAQVENPGGILQTVAGVFEGFKHCILDKVLSLGICDDCLSNSSISLMNAQTMLVSLEYAIEQGFIEEAREIKKALTKFCSSDCSTCGKYNNISDNLYYDFKIR